MYERSRAEEPDRDREESFEDRALRLVTTLGGAGVLHGDLTPECTAAAQAVLDALSAPADAEDTRTQEQRCHDTLGEAIEQAVIGKAVDLLSGPGGLASFLRRRQLGVQLGGPACRWTSATPRRSRPAFVTRSSCAISGAGGPAAATSLGRRAKSTMSSTRPTAARPAPKSAFFCVSIITRS
jgi:hypothetical protein